MSEDKKNKIKNKIIVFHKEELRKDYNDMTMEEVLEERLLLNELRKDVHKIGREIREHHANLAARKRLLEVKADPLHSRR